MKVYSTRGVSIESLHEFCRDAGEALNIEVDESQFVGKSDVSAVVSLLGEITWWRAMEVTALGVAGKYLYGLADSAAKEHWSKRKEIAAGSAAGVKKLASAITKLVQREKPLSISVGVPFPDGYFSTHLDLTGTEEEQITTELALFVEHLPQLQTLIEEMKENKPATGIFLKLLEDGSLEAYWFDGKNLRKGTRVLRLITESNNDVPDRRFSFSPSEVRARDEA